MENNEENIELIEILAFLAASGRVNSEDVLPVLEKLTGGTKGLCRIMTVLDSKTGDEFIKIKDSLHRSLLEDAHKLYKHDSSQTLPEPGYFEQNLEGFPLNVRVNWFSGNRAAFLKDFADLSNDYFFIRSYSEKLPHIAAKVSSKVDEIRHKLFTSPYLWARIEPENLLRALWNYIDDDARKVLRQSKSTIKQTLQDLEDEAAATINARPDVLNVNDHDSYLRALLQWGDKPTLFSNEFLNALIFWPDRDIIPLYKKLLSQEKLKHRMDVLLTMRFGKVPGGWDAFFDLAWEEHLKENKKIQEIVNANPAFFLLMWCRKSGIDDESVNNCLKGLCRERAQEVSKEEFAERWDEHLTPIEKRKLLGREEKPKVLEPQKEESALKKKEESPKETEPVAVAQEVVETTTLPKAVKEVPVVRKPSVWDEHFKPFLSENWFMMAGVILFVVGSGILSYVTWDKHWLFRYTLMPALLAFFTASLAYLGRWIQSKDANFKVTATILRGAAVQLLPVNFMTIALLSSDQTVSYKSLVVPLMSLAYLVIARQGMRRICGAVFEGFRNSLSRSILLLNLLVILAPLASTFGLQDKQKLLMILGLGFYAGFFIVCQSVYHFSKSSLTEHLIKDKSLLWFFGLSTVGTFLQVFGLVHSQIRHLPQGYTYAPMLIGTAALILLIERKMAAILKRGQSLGSESFLAYSLIILGVLLAITNEYARVICCLLAGAAWFIQASQRKSLIHYHICLSFFITGIFCIGLLRVFPGDYTSGLGLVSAFLLEVLARKSRRHKDYELAKACVGTQVVALLITVIVAVLCQLSFNTPALLVAGSLTICAAWFIYRAYEDEQLHWVHAAMFTAAITLPYTGCVDLERGTLEGNTLIFGLSVLSILWVLAVRFIKFPLLKEARSTVLWFYGILAVTAMIIRVVMERHSPVDPRWYMAFMDYTGPIVMAMVLVLASWYSRSLIPAFMASIIVIILFPELKQNFRATFEMVGFGSGLGSACSALGIILASFFLRRHPGMQALTEQDKFLNRFHFPYKRYDHTLFTWPLMLSAGFLLVKTGSFNLLRQISHGGVSVKGAVALIIGGLCAWLLCVYYRQSKGHRAFHPGWFYTGLGLTFLFEQVFPTLSWSWPVLSTLVSLQLLHFVSWRLQKKYDWLQELFVNRTSFVLASLSHLAGLFCLVHMIDNQDKMAIISLVFFLVCQFIWHGLQRIFFLKDIINYCPSIV